MGILKRIFGFVDRGPDPRAEANAATRKAVEAHAEAMPPQARDAFLKTFSQIERIVNAGKTDGDFWWYGVERTAGPKVVYAVCESPSVRDYLNRHGVEIKAYPDSFKIEFGHNPPEGSFGAELLANLRLYQEKEPERREAQAIANCAEEEERKAEIAIADGIRNGM